MRWSALTWKPLRRRWSKRCSAVCRSGLPRPTVGDQSSSMNTTRPGSRALRKGRTSIPGQVYHVTARTKRGLHVFANPVAAFTACAAFHKIEADSDARLLAWVLMHDHAHWLIELGELDDLSHLVARLKNASAGACNDALGAARATSVWQAGYFDRAIRRDEDLLAVARYVVANPLRAGLVARLGDYSWWDSTWL